MTPFSFSLILTGGMVMLMWLVWQSARNALLPGSFPVLAKKRNSKGITQIDWTSAVSTQ